MDVWEIDSIGRIISRTENKDKDEVFTVTSSGDTTSVSFAYGTIEQQENRKVGDEVKYTWFDVRGDENGTKLFEFFANNTTVEWSQFMMGVEGDKGLNVISTSHDEGTDEAGRFLLMNKLQYGYTIREHYHNHPNYAITPSGRKSTENGKLKGDYGFATWISRYTRNKSTKYFIYVRNHELVPYFPIP